jgi:excisionase family DNA binding protein
MENSFLTAKDIANRLRISKALAYRLISEGKIKSFCFGKRAVRVRLSDFEDFIETSVTGQDTKQPSPKSLPKNS